MFLSVRTRFPPGQDLPWLDILQHLYSRTYCRFPKAGPTATFPSTSGTKQGGPEGPVLFSLLFNVCMRDFMELAQALDIDFFTYRYRSNSHAIRTADRDPRNTPKGEHTLSWCGYAGDLVLLTKSQNSLDTATSELSSTFGNTR